MSGNLEAFEGRVGHQFADKALLQQAFVHRSYTNEHRTFPLGDNERLEFLGDAVLELVVTHFLYTSFPNPEGELTTWRSALVRGEMLAKIAQGMAFDEHLLLSQGEARSGGKAKQALLANAFEALIGAIYLDAGYAAANDFIHRELIPELPAILDNKLFIDPKSRLQEITQERFGTTPTYAVLEEEGPDHEKTFTVSVVCRDQELGRGTGSSKQSAQVAAAEIALRALTEN